MPHRPSLGLVGQSALFFLTAIFCRLSVGKTMTDPVKIADGAIGTRPESVASPGGRSRKLLSITCTGDSSTSVAANDNWPIVLTRSEAATMCSISLSTFDMWVSKGILPGPISGTRRWSRVAICRALANGLIERPIVTDHSPFDEWKRANAD
jgi:hypothetical protein